MQVTVQTKNDLKKAIENKVDTIIVTGSLAGNVIKAQKIAKLGKFALASLGLTASAIVAAVAAAPVTGGVSFAVAVPLAAPLAALTGLEIATIIFACLMGVGMLIAFYKEYDIIEMSAKQGVLTVRFEKKK